jgi:hemolysin activation/secretion protein
MMRVFFHNVVWLIVTVLFVAPHAVSQTLAPNVEQALRQSQSEIARQRVPQPLPQPRDYEIFIQQTEKTPVEKAVDELEFDLKSVRITGSSYYSPEQLRSMFSHLIGKKVTLSDLRGVAELLETRYREAGFFLTRVFLPPQQVKNGEFEVRVIEGYISAGFSEGGKDVARERIEALLNHELVGKKPLSLAGLERTLLVANDFPGYAVSSMLRQGTDLGSSEIVATLIEVPGTQSFSINNQSSNVTGPWSFAYSGTFNDKLGRGEQISIGVNTGNSAAVLKSTSLRYAEPIGSRGLVGSIGVLLSEANPAGAVAPPGLLSVGSSITPRLRYPLMRSRDSSVYVESGLTINKTHTSLSGVVISSDQFTVWDGNATWLYKLDSMGNGNVRIALAKGVPYFGAMTVAAPNPSVSGFDPGFSKWTYALQHTMPLANSVSAQVALNGQITSASTKLLSGEQISFGGGALGRGYDGGAISGDAGMGLLLELRYDMPYNHPALLAPVQWYLFADAAEATTHANKDTPATTRFIASHGFGSRFVFAKNITLDLQYARAVHYFPSPDTRSNPRLTVSSSLNF